MNYFKFYVDVFGCEYFRDTALDDERDFADVYCRIYIRNGGNPTFNKFMLHGFYSRAVGSVMVASGVNHMMQSFITGIVCCPVPAVMEYNTVVAAYKYFFGDAYTPTPLEVNIVASAVDEIIDKVEALPHNDMLISMFDQRFFEASHHIKSVLQILGQADSFLCSYGAASLLNQLAHKGHMLMYFDKIQSDKLCDELCYFSLEDILASLSATRSKLTALIKLTTRTDEFMFNSHTVSVEDDELWIDGMSWQVTAPWKIHLFYCKLIKRLYDMLVKSNNIDPAMFDEWSRQTMKTTEKQSYGQLVSYSTDACFIIHDSKFLAANYKADGGTVLLIRALNTKACFCYGDSDWNPNRSDDEVFLRNLFKKTCLDSATAQDLTKSILEHFSKKENEDVKSV